MPVALALLQSIAGKAFGKILEREVIGRCFPDTFKADVLAGLDDVKRQLATIGQDTAFATIQPTRHSYIEALDYFGKFQELLKQQFNVGPRSNKIPDEAVLAGAAARLVEFADKLEVAYDEGVEVFDRRIGTCDYPLRLLFETLRDMAALRLTMLFWAHALKGRDPAMTDERGRIAIDYQDFRRNVAAFVHAAPERICAARTAKITYELTVKRHPMVNRIESVTCMFRDVFQSDYSGDPFKGQEIRDGYKEQMEPWDVLFMEDVKQAILRKAATDRAEEKRKACEIHRQAVIDLCNRHVAEPTTSFLEEWEKTPGNLDVETPAPAD